MEGILKKLQKVMKRTQKWKDVEKNGTTYMKAYPKGFPATIICLFSDFGDRSRPLSLKG
jgi:hypothetical protein